MYLLYFEFWIFQYDYLAGFRVSYVGFEFLTGIEPHHTEQLADMQP